MNDFDGRLADALKRVSEHHFTEAPLGPRGAQRAVVERVRRRWRSFLIVNGVVAVLLVSSAAFMVPRLMGNDAGDSGPRGDTVGQPTPSVPPTPDVIDIQMTELQEAFRRRPLSSAHACGGFDFQLREKIGGRQYRPAFCKRGNTRTILLFSFANQCDRRLWIRRGRPTQFSLPGRTVIVTGDTWEMHFDTLEMQFTDTALAQKVATELQGRIVDQ
jgi:hypothetical protein